MPSSTSSCTSTTLTPTSGRAPPPPPPAVQEKRFPGPAVLRTIFASSRTVLEERSLSRRAFFRFAGFLLSCLGISLAAARGRPGGIKSGAALLGVFARMADIIDLTVDSPGTEAVEENPLAVARVVPPELILVIFIHGFKGTDDTFGPFPDRLQHIVSESVPNVKVECIVFPAYETKGVLPEAVDRFADWLVMLAVEREVAHGTGGGAGKAKIVLCGHSMGGLLAADILIQLADSRVDKAAPLWPRIIALIAFDTPYLGLHPFVFRNQAAKATEILQTAHSLWQTFGTSAGGATTTATAAAAAPASASVPLAALPSTAATPSLWTRYAAPAAYAAGSAIAAGVLGAAYTRRAELVGGAGWLGDHAKYVSHLWDQAELRARLARVCALSSELGLPFRTFYTYLPAKPPARAQAPTFCILPAPGAPGDGLFVRAPNTLAESEVDAHTGMFAGRTNDGYYQLGLDTAAIIREAIMSTRGVYDPDVQAATTEDLLA